jgi:hypothetical protein
MESLENYAHVEAMKQSRSYNSSIALDVKQTRMKDGA